MKLLALEQRTADKLFKEYKLKPKGFWFMDDSTDKPLKTSIQSGIAVIPINGIISEESLWFTDSVKASEIQAAVEAAAIDDSITKIILDINSPGGDMVLIADAAQAIFEARGLKEVVAYTSNLCCSAAYWLASAASKIVCNDSALIGSIGCIMTVKRNSENEYSVDIVSSQSPNKILNPDDPTGNAKLQTIVDDMAEVFINAISKYRGVTAELIKNSYGQGDVLIAGKALKAGMIDEIGNFKQAKKIIKEDVLLKKEISIEKKPKEKQDNNTLQSESKNIKTGVNKMSKLFAKINKNKISAKLVIVDDEVTEIPDGVPVEEITREWLNENLPDLVQEILDAGAETETERIEEVNEIESQDSTETEMVAKARKDRKMTGKILAFDILKYRKGASAAIIEKRSKDNTGSIDTGSAQEQEQDEIKIRTLAKAAAARIKGRK